MSDIYELYQEKGLELEMTCGACPEQYDVKKDGKIVGYIRLRWGYLRADYPDCGGETIYNATIGDGQWTGSFDDEGDERTIHLIKIRDKILEKIEE